MCTVGFTKKVNRDRGVGANQGSTGTLQLGVVEEDSYGRRRKSEEFVS